MLSAWKEWSDIKNGGKSLGWLAIMSCVADEMNHSLFATKKAHQFTLLSILLDAQ
jgi:hypothetical protein